MLSPPPSPDNRRSLLRLTVATAVFTVVLVYFARPPWRVVAVAVASASLAAVGSVGITASATWFRRWRERRRLPRQERLEEQPIQEQQPLQEQIREQQPLEEEQQIQEQQRQELLRSLDQMTEQQREERLHLLERGLGALQQDLERLSDQERRGGLTDERDFLVWQIGELRRRLGRDR
jgi:TolA-binding protein